MQSWSSGQPDSRVPNRSDLRNLFCWVELDREWVGKEVGRREKNITG